jgi:hypothetical protein
VPVGLFAATVVWMLYCNRETPTRKLPIDKVGLLSLIVWVGALQIMLDKGKDLAWFESPTIWILTIVAVLGFLFFLVWELTEAKPIIDLRLFGQRNFLGGTVAISVADAAFFANLVILPTWIQEYLGYRAVDAGIVTAPLGIFAVLLAPLKQDYAEIGPAGAGHACLSWFFRCVRHAFMVPDGRKRPLAGATDAAAGHPDGAVLHAAHRDYPIGFAAREDTRGRGPL